MDTQRSVGIVTPQVAHFDKSLRLACGRQLATYDIVYETYGELNEQRSNAVLVCHALSGNHHAAGYHSEEEKKPGWWDECIGPGKPIDTNRFFVVSLNNLGGCHGSTGPSSINPDTGKPWGKDFPPMRVSDWVHSQARLADRLEIECWAAVIGGSLGGMQAMRWSLEYPDRIKHCVVIAAALKLSAQNLAFNEVARQAIESDPNFADGEYQETDSTPAQGLALARMIGHITYLSDDAMANKFGRELRSGTLQHGLETNPEFQVQSYLRYQGSQFSGRFDANTYVLMTKALDYFDLAHEYRNDPGNAFNHARCSFLAISFSTDWRFSPERSREIVDALISAGKQVSYAEIDANEGHDAFLMPIPRYLKLFSAYMQRVGAGNLMRLDLSHIQRWVEHGSRVLDLGCGDGELLVSLRQERQVRGLGLEIDEENITAALARGLDIIEQNMDEGLSNFPDQSFDTVVMTHALQVVHYPDRVLEEMLRIGREGIVTFPNFGHWRCRLHLGLKGTMPVSESMPDTWYDTPNIHFCTVRDFENLCRDRGIRILARDVVGNTRRGPVLSTLWPNLFATTAIYRITR